ncbi:MAG: hypothetical protein L0Z53_06885 [Acidobacteriales bacterium]|nr:hypothetical protein [Terriglobales bacterium]
MRELSKVRLYAMRFIYLGTGIFVGINAWTALITRTTPWDPLHGIAFSFWAAYSVLMLLGVRFPVKMLPLLLLQLFYKLTWLIAVAYPLWLGGQWNPWGSALFRSCAIAAVVDLIVIPWPFVFQNYLKAIFKPAPPPGSLLPQPVSSTAK